MAYAFPTPTARVSSPKLSPLGVVIQGETGDATASVGPNVGEGTASPEAQGLGGRLALATELAQNVSPTNTALRAMGLFGGPIASLAVTGLRAAMTAHNASVISGLLDDPQTNLAIQEAGALGFNQALTAPLGREFTDPAPNANAPGLTPQGLTANPANTNFGPQPDAPGAAPAGPSTSDPTGGAEGQYDQGGHVPHRMLASLKGGEYVVRAEAVPRHRKLLEQINGRVPKR